jgi:hypothetical protein
MTCVADLHAIARDVDHERKKNERVPTTQVRDALGSGLRRYTPSSFFAFNPAMAATVESSRPVETRCSTGSNSAMS